MTSVRWSKVVRGKLLVILRDKDHRSHPRWLLELNGLQQSDWRTLREAKDAAAALEWIILIDRGPLACNRSYQK